jgi:hypothetical protein
MRKLFLSLLALNALLFVLDRAVGAGMAHLFRTSTNEEEGDRFGRAIAAQPEVVISGSSRALHHYVADSLGTMLGARVYNLGRDGAWGGLYQYGAAAILLRHGTPRLWILDVFPQSYSEPEVRDYLSCFLPYVDQEPAAAEVAVQRSRWERIRMLSKTYPYNSLLVSLLAPKLGKAAHPRDGYLELMGVMAVDTTHAPQAPKGSGPFPRDPLKMKYLRKAIALLKSHGVEVIAVRSPQFVAGEAARAQDRRIRADCARVYGELRVRYLDFSPLDHPEYADARLYQDAEHLNGTGALRFTRALADSISALEVGHADR